MNKDNEPQEINKSEKQPPESKFRKYANEYQEEKERVNCIEARKAFSELEEITKFVLQKAEQSNLLNIYGESKYQRMLMYIERIVKIETTLLNFLEEPPQPDELETLSLKERREICQVKANYIIKQIVKTMKDSSLYPPPC